VGSENREKVEVEEHVAVPEHERVGIHQQPASLAQGSARTGDPRLVRDLEREPQRLAGGSRRRRHLLPEVVGVDDHAADARAAEQGEGIAEERDAQERHRRLGNLVGQGPQARPQAGAQHHRGELTHSRDRLPKAEPFRGPLLQPPRRLERRREPASLPGRQQAGGELRLRGRAL
jgi:hypothetical protein